jgi:Holliday junction resolvasome RuvABC endonuclease subunit
MPVAGFDPSLTHFGWVILDENKKGKKALLDYGTFRTEPADGLLIQRLLMQKERVRKFLTENDIRLISMEAPFWQNFSTEILFAMNQFLHEVFLDLSSYVVYIQPSSLKKYAIPDMNPNEVTKHHMVHQAKTELDKHGSKFSEHLADAYFVGTAGWWFYRWFFLKVIKEEDLPDYLRELFCGKHTYKRGIKKGLTEYKGIIYRENDQFFDYSKQSRKLKDITEEIQNG